MVFKALTFLTFIVLVCSCQTIYKSELKSYGAESDRIQSDRTQTDRLRSDRFPSSIEYADIPFFDRSTLNSEQVKIKYFDVRKDLAELELHIKSFVDEYKKIKKLEKDGGLSKNVEQMVVSDGLVYPYNQFDILDKSLYLGSLKMLSNIEKMRSGENTALLEYQIVQIATALRHNYTEPYKSAYEILMLPVYVGRLLSNPKIVQTNKIDESPDYIRQLLLSEFMRADANLYDYSRVKNNLANCTYLKSKKGYGVHAGFQISCADDEYEDEYKVKFGSEIYSGPFNSRIYRVMGYRSPQINYVDELSVKYDRRILTEINDRKEIRLKIRVAGIKVKETTNKKYFDPFRFIKAFKLKNGTVISAKDAKLQLINDQTVFQAERILILDKHINEDFEKQIDEVVFVPVTITTKNDPEMGEEVGYWTAADVNYKDIKEVRALIVLSAWIGNYDIRKDNLSVLLTGDVKKRIDDAQIRLALGDVGSGLGKATVGIKFISASKINEMDWEISKTYQAAVPRSSGKGYDMQKKISLDGFTNIEYSRAFNKIKITDGHWMLEKMCQITKKQIMQALVASGMSSAEVVLATEKLLSRRNKMLEDFSVSDELREKCSIAVDRHISYNPADNGTITVYSDELQQYIEAPVRGKKVVNGVIVPL